MYESCTAQLNEWKSVSSKRVRMKREGRIREGGKDDENLVAGTLSHTIRWQIGTNIYDKIKVLFQGMEHEPD